MCEWEKISLGNITTWSSGGTPSKSNPLFWNGNIPWISARNMPDGWVEYADTRITKEGLNAGSNIAPTNSILMLVRGSGLFNRRYISIVKNPVAFNQDIKCIMPTDFVLPLFLYYILRGMDTCLLGMLETTGIGAGKFDTKRLQQMSIQLPPLPEQKAIASVLSTLDDKIELNNQINKKLEEMAQAIFKSWFVDFEPWGGVMPKDWREGSLLDIADYLNGLAMQKFRPKENEIGIPVLKIKELRQGNCDSSSELCSSNIKQEYIIHDGDVIFSWSGSLLVDIWCSGDCGLNQHLFKVSSRKYDKWFYYLWTCFHLEQFVSMAADKATTMGHIKREALESAKVIIPSADDYNRINALSTPIINQIIGNRIENNRLAAIRDALLPKLMSGEIRVPLEVE